MRSAKTQISLHISSQSEPAHLHSLISVDKRAKIRNWYYQIPHPALNTKRERDFAVRSMNLRTQGSFMHKQKLWSDWVDAQADLSLHWVHKSFY